MRGISGDRLEGGREGGQADEDGGWPGKRAAARALDRDPGKGPATRTAAPAGLPYGAELAQAFGQDFSDVEVRLGGAEGSGRGAYARVEGGRDVVAFDQGAPAKEQVAHELAHVTQRRQFGEGPVGVAGLGSASEIEARAVAPLAAAGQQVAVHAAPDASVLRDDDVASRVHEKLHGWITDDEAGALHDLQSDPNRALTVTTYRSRYGVQIWTDFIDNASGDTLNRALALLYPHMSLLDKLGTHLGVLNDDEAGILQSILNATDAQIAEARSGIQPYIDQLDAPDAYRARMRVWPDRRVENLVHFLSEGDGWFWDDEGPVATAIMQMSATDRHTLWEQHSGAFGMFNDHDREQIHQMCMGDDAHAADIRMQLATDGAGTDEDGVTAAVGYAASARDERAQIEHALATGMDIPPPSATGGAPTTTATMTSTTPPTGTTPLTEERRAALRRRLAEIGDVNHLLDAHEGTGSDGALDPNSFLGRAQGDLDAGSMDALLGTARADTYERTKQALLGTVSWTSDVDETAVLRIIHDVQGSVTLEAGETAESVGAAELRRRRETSRQDIIHRLRNDPDLREVWGALDSEETGYVDAAATGDTYTMALHDLSEAFHSVDTDEAAILRIIHDAPAADRERMSHNNPDPVGDIRQWAVGYPSFQRALNHVLETGEILADAALDEAMGGDFDGTNVDLIQQTFAGLSPADRRQLRRGYLLAHRPATPVSGGAAATMAPPRARAAAPMSEADSEALGRYTALRTRLESELSASDLDAALQTMLDVPTEAEMADNPEQGRLDAAELMLYRQRERLEMTAGITSMVSTTDDTAAAAHVEFESRYNVAVGEGAISPELFAILVHLDQQFNERFRDFEDTANQISEIAGTIAAVVVGAAILILSGGTASAAAPGVIAWLSANSTLIAGTAVASAVAQVTVAEATGGDFHETLGAQGAREALSAALNGAMMVCGSALAEHAAELVGLSGPSLTAAIARAAAGSLERGVGRAAVARGALMGLIDGSLGGAVGELAMTATDAQTWRHRCWEIIGSFGAALIRGAVMGGTIGAVTGGAMERAQAALRARSIARCVCQIDESLGSAAHIDFTVSEAGQIEGLTLRMGPNVSDADLAAHVDRVRSIDRAGTLLGRAMTTLRGEESAGTRSGNAAEEVRKIRDMIQARLRLLRGELAPSAREVIDGELDVLESNLGRYMDLAAAGDTTPVADGVGSPRSPGPGYPALPDGYYYRQINGEWTVQRRSTSVGPARELVPDGPGQFRVVVAGTVPVDPTVPTPLHDPPPEGWYYYRTPGGAWDIRRYPGEGGPDFELVPDPATGRIRPRAVDGSVARPPDLFTGPTATTRGAFEALTGPSSTSSFRQYYAMLRANGIATEEEVIAALTSLGPLEGARIDNIRHALKGCFEARVLAHAQFVNGVDGALRTEAEAMTQMRHLTENLNPSDRGNLMEEWYQMRRGGLDGHPTMSATDNPGLVTGRDGGNAVRYPDFVEGSTLVEMKSTARGLSDEEVRQIGESLAVTSAGGRVRVDGVERTVNQMRLVFPDIRGARGCADQLEEWLLAHPRLTLEVFDTQGVAQNITGASLRARGVDSLAALLETM